MIFEFIKSKVVILHGFCNEISLISGGSAKLSCHEEGHCPDEKACFNYCVGLGLCRFRV